MSNSEHMLSFEKYYANSVEISSILQTRKFDERAKAEFKNFVRNIWLDGAMHGVDAAVDKLSKAGYL